MLDRTGVPPPVPASDRNPALSVALRCLLLVEPLRAPTAGCGSAAARSRRPTIGSPAARPFSRPCATETSGLPSPTRSRRSRSAAPPRPADTSRTTPPARRRRVALQPLTARPLAGYGSTQPRIRRGGPGCPRNSRTGRRRPTRTIDVARAGRRSWNALEGRRRAVALAAGRTEPIVVPAGWARARVGRLQAIERPAASGRLQAQNPFPCRSRRRTGWSCRHRRRSRPPRSRRDRPPRRSRRSPGQPPDRIRRRHRRDLSRRPRHLPAGDGCSPPPARAKPSRSGPRQRRACRAGAQIPDTSVALAARSVRHRGIPTAIMRRSGQARKAPAPSPCRSVRGALTGVTPPAAPPPPPAPPVSNWIVTRWGRQIPE